MGIFMDMESFLDQDRFDMVIQPIVDLRNGCTFTGEALARLNHPEHGNIPVDVVIATVDAMELYTKFDLYIFRKCCIWLSRAVQEGKRFDCLSCNFSRKTLSHPGIVREMILIADSYAVAYHTLGIEITEWKRETNLQQITENLWELKKAGFRILLDDYGSGVTTENDLHHFPLDTVKLDQSMLMNVDTEKGSTAFRTLVAQLTRMGMEVVCEGIETEAQSILAREAGCHYGQGFLYFPPIPQDMVSELVATIEPGKIAI